jgi:hypothetical protein
MALTKALVLASNYTTKQPVPYNSYLNIGGLIPPTTSQYGALAQYSSVG